MTDAGLIVKGLTLGLSAAVPIGPVNVEIARRTLRGGFAAGFALGCGAVTVDISYAILTSLSLKPVLSWPGLHLGLSVGGVLLLLYLAGMSFKGAYQASRGDLLAAQPRPSIHGGYLTGVLMTLLNPMTLAFWFLVLPATAGRLTETPAGDLPLICVGVFLGTIGWVISFSGLLSFAGRYRRNWWLVAADVVGGTMLLAFAIYGAFCVRRS